MSKKLPPLVLAGPRLAPNLGTRCVQSRTLHRFALPLLASFTLLGCNRSPEVEGGAETAGASSTGQPSNYETAPDVEPRYNQTQGGVISRVVTNMPATAAALPSGAQADPDQVLAEKVHVALSTGTTGTTGVYSEDMLLDMQVTASNGVVTLRGEVGSEQARQAFGERARAIEGVRQVNNELAVNPNKMTPGPRPGAPSGRGKVNIVPQTQNQPHELDR